MYENACANNIMFKFEIKQLFLEGFKFISTTHSRVRTCCEYSQEFLRGGNQKYSQRAHLNKYENGCANNIMFKAKQLFFEGSDIIFMTHSRVRTCCEDSQEFLGGGNLKHSQRAHLNK